MKIAKSSMYALAVGALVSAMFLAATASAGTYLSASSDSYLYESDDDTLLCSASDSRSHTGRQLAILRPSPREPELCVRIKLGGAAGNDVPDCWKAARYSGFNCAKIIDAN